MIRLIRLSRMARSCCWPSLALLLFTAAPAGAADSIALHVDARETASHILHVRETLPAAPGPLALAYPKWIPGEHGPTGPVSEVAGLRIEAGGQPLAWRRDDVDMYVVRCEVPKGAGQVEVAFDFMLTTSTEGYSFAGSSTVNLLVLSWNQVLFYPAGRASDALTFAADLALPGGWKYGTALPVAAEQGARVVFAPASLTTLVDSPVLCGSHFRRFELTPGDAAPSFLDVAADGEAALAIPDSIVARYSALAREAPAFFGGRHYRDYHFLLTLSDHVAHFGLEHHESSDDRQAERTYLEDDLRRQGSGLLSHELSHSWNGKYRRPTGLATPDYGTPMKGELLWVYEGLTNYAGWVLAGRSGVRTPEESRENLAYQAALMEYNRGREWRPLVDTAVEAQLLYEARDAGSSWRRGVDFYDEMTLVWLEADVTIRRLTNDAKSLDDFCHAFHGGTGGPELVRYTREEVVNGLNAVVAWDWDTFLRQRVDTLRPHLALDSGALGGWALGWSDTLSTMMSATETARDVLDETWSIGCRIDSKTLQFRVKDVVPGSPAALAGLAPETRLIAVNGRALGAKVLRDAMKAAKNGGPLELLVQDGEFFRTLKLEWRGGLRYPVLRRDASQPDRLTEILKAHAGR
jgi:predicted metalloprotease with PDZ domain